MCPACLAAAALITGTALSTGALTAILAKKFWTKNFINGNVAQNKGKENKSGGGIGLHGAGHAAADPAN